MQGKQFNQPRMLQTINIEALVPKNYILRHIDQAVDLTFIRAKTAKLYTEGLGRYSIPPELVLRLFLLEYLFDLSDRTLCNEVAMHAGFRWFCRLNFDDPVPDRTTLVKLRRLWGITGVFAEAMREIVEQCVRAGLVDGRAIGVDGTQVTANAATKSLAPLAPVVSLEGWLKRKAQEDAATPEQTGGTSGDSGPGGGASGPTGGTAADEAPAASPSLRQGGDPNFHGERFSNQTHRSTTDPQALLYRKGAAQEAKLRYLVHDLMDLRSRVILSTGATQATGTAEREAALAMLDEALPLLPPTRRQRRCVADAGYVAGWFLAAVLRRGVDPVVPMASTTPEPIPTWERRPSTPEQFLQRMQKIQEAQARNHVRRRQGPRTTRRLQRARTRLEHGFAEGKQWHGLRRARGRGLLALNTQALLTAMVQNVKRLAAYRRRKAPKTALAPFFLVVRGLCLHLMRWLPSASPRRLQIVPNLRPVRPVFSPSF